MIDLHLHTTASDGRCPPEELPRLARGAGLDVISITDHDTTAGLAAAAAGCRELGLELVDGIEITAMQEDEDVHVLGYFIDPADVRLAAFLAGQRVDRLRRLRAMIDGLRSLGMALDAERVLEAAGALEGRAMGRPLLARAMVEAGFVQNTREAFDLYLARGRAAWVPRRAPLPGEVVELIHAAGGVASLAHPAMLGHDEWIPGVASSGLDALEVYYGDHSPELTVHYRDLALQLGLEMTGGSDFHGDPAHGKEAPGQCLLPPEAFEGLKVRLSRRRDA